MEHIILLMEHIILLMEHMVLFYGTYRTFINEKVAEI